MKTIFIVKCFLISLIIFSVNSCRPKDDRDFIINYLKNAKNGDINALNECLIYEHETKEVLEAKTIILVTVMKDSELPEKDKIENIINDGEFQCYSLTLVPSGTEILINLKRLKNNIKILNIDIIRIPVLF